MKAFSGSGLVPNHSWILGALALLLLPACATTRLAEEEEPSDRETVDIGYGTVDEDQLVGSVSTVHSDDLPDVVRYRTLAEMLIRVPGVQVTELGGGNLRVRIRGAASFLGGQEPLYVLDGMVIRSIMGISGMDTNTIESITVLKDAGATAIYGSRGANGVIIIKTKGGSK